MPDTVRLFILMALSALWIPAIAQADEVECHVPMADWQPKEAVQAYAQSQGLAVERIKIDDGCYKVYAHDAQNNDIRLKLNPATLEPQSIRSRHDNHRD